MDDAKTIKDVYDHWNIPYQRGKDGEYVEEIHLVVTDTGYINYLDDESIFYDNSYPMEELFCFGDIVIEFSNSIRDAKKIIEMFEIYSKKYHQPNIEFVKECYNAFRELGYSDLVTRCIVNGVLVSLYHDNTFDKFNFREYFVLWVCVNPLKILSKEHYMPDAFAKVTFWEDHTGTIQLCYSEFENYSLQVLDAIYARKNNVIFHKCSYCNGYFIERNGNNKKFCSNCKNIHSDLKSDDFRKAYRKAYKTMQQRAKRYENAGKDYFEYSSKYNEPFENEALSKQDLYREKGDITGYIKFLEELKTKYKPTKGGQTNETT